MMSFTLDFGVFVPFLFVASAVAVGSVVGFLVLAGLDRMFRGY